MEQTNKDKLFSWQERHYTVWRQVKRIYDIDRPNKYCVVFNTYTNSVKSFSITPFDTLDEALEEAKLINIVYSPTLRPKKIYKRYYSYRHSRIRDFEYDFSDGSYFWGYMILDMTNYKIIKLVNTVKMPSHVFSGKITLNDIDVLFRREDEVPDDYIWDARGEYDGWLQFRWGDGKNAIDYVEPPKKEHYKDFEYDDINVSDEYLDKIDKENFNIETPTTSSLAEILSDKNPLLKLLKK